ncbi:induced myeloid leukemia cell differentiation protein Mcl-1 homolog [Heptranchias perlo]|uniref:induced myeloid leukemia cell differentiation protein Mcl-1 homolog n=1 Tax=Heptranchias perlo TaxID=212740 RepID=UPI00355A011B
MEQTVLALNRTSSSALLQLQNQFYCSSRGPLTADDDDDACGPPRLLPGAGDGSLPLTPVEEDDDDDGGSPAESPATAATLLLLFPHDPFYRRTYALVRGFIRRHAQQPRRPREDGGWFGWERAKEGEEEDGNDRLAADTLQKIGDRLIEKHGTAFTGMINRLNISGKSDLDAIPRVATEMFSDGEVNWGRVVSFIAFGAVMGDHLKKIQREDCIDDVAAQVTQYLTGQKKEWLETHNGWDGFTQFFHENNAEESTKKVLMWIAGFGLAGAGIMHLLR